MLNIITVKVGNRYSADYPNRMLSMLRRHLKTPFRFYCITDNPAGLDRDILSLCPIIPLAGWWNKLLLFSPFVPSGRMMYLDLDQVITGDITEMVENARPPFACYADHIEWQGVKLGTAMMIFDPSDYHKIWRDFYQHREHVMRRYADGGDQIYLGQFFGGEVDYLNERYPGAIASYKFDLNREQPGPGVKLVNFHGRPKPHEVEQPWLLEHWR